MAVRPRKGSVAICSRRHLPAPGYDQLGERRFEFIPLWGFLVFLLYTMRRVDCRRCGVVTVEEVPWGDGKRTLTKAAGTQAPYRITVRKSVLSPFHRICTPMHTRMNDDRRMMTFMPESPRVRPMRSAKR